jgi:hypothetical protein
MLVQVLVGAGLSAQVPRILGSYRRWLAVRTQQAPLLHRPDDAVVVPEVGGAAQRQPWDNAIRRYLRCDDSTAGYERYLGEVAQLVRVLANEAGVPVSELPRLVGRENQARRSWSMSTFGYGARARLCGAVPGGAWPLGRAIVHSAALRCGCGGEGGWAQQASGWAGVALASQTPATRWLRCARSLLPTEGRSRPAESTREPGAQ